MTYGRYGGGGSRDFNRGFAPKPVEIGKEYDVEVTEVSRQGDGIARVQGYVIFVKNGKPGQKHLVSRSSSIVINLLMHTFYTLEK